MSVRLLVTGGRSYNNRRFLFSVLDGLHAQYVLTDVGHGQCHLGGADYLAGAWAREYHITEHRFPVRETVDGPWPRAGNRRNERMFHAFLPQIVVAFKGGGGTKHMLDYALGARRRGYDVTVFDARDDVHCRAV